MPSERFIDFQGRQVLVSGASSGIGRAVAVELSRRGAKLLLLGRDEKELKATGELLESADCVTADLDLRDHALILPKIREIGRNAGRIYGLCHCAGIVETRPLTSSKVEGLREMMDVNLTAGIELAKAVCRRDVMEEDGGSILFISSIYGIVGMPGQIGYSATKGALIAAARAMAAELARRNIRVNTISPGLVKTEMTAKSLALLSEEQVKALEDRYPLGTGRPEDVARAVVFLLAPQNTWITGINLAVDGGYTAV
jgi:NAD(P)-dependent dehydrogenase (short-subunit alcohol dehydrogenase family)